MVKAPTGSLDIVNFVSCFYKGLGFLKLADIVLILINPKGQLISKCLFEKIVWTKKPPKNLIDSALKYCRAESIKFFSGFLVQTIFSKRHFEIN